MGTNVVSIFKIAFASPKHSTSHHPAYQYNSTASTRKPTVKLDTLRPFQQTEHIDNLGNSSMMFAVSMVNKRTVAQTTTYQNVSLLFVITVVFNVCWLSFWLYDKGVPIAPKVTRFQRHVPGRRAPFLPACSC